MKRIRIGTRSSALALAQAGWLGKKLEQRYSDLEVETVTIKTSGDRFFDVPMKSIGGKGIFVKEIEEALLRKEIDVAVHSLKDLPTEIPEGLVLGAVPEREDPADVLVCSGARRFADLPSGARLGTGSLRRRSQILYCRPDLEIVPIRGNIDTRLRKLDRGEVDALVLAAAGLKRIEREDRISESLPPEICLGAVGQGALGLEVREKDDSASVLGFLHHQPTAAAVLAERAFLRRLGGGCHIPVAARGWTEGGRLRLMGAVGDVAGKTLLRGERGGPADDPERLGVDLAEELLIRGADRVLSMES